MNLVNISFLLGPWGPIENSTPDFLNFIPCRDQYANLNRLCFGPGHVSLPYAWMAEWLARRTLNQLPGGRKSNFIPLFFLLEVIFFFFFLYFKVE